MNREGHKDREAVAGVPSPGCGETVVRMEIMADSQPRLR
jgi:hypothetical protein